MKQTTSAELLSYELYSRRCVHGIGGPGNTSIQWPDTDMLPCARQPAARSGCFTSQHVLDVPPLMNPCEVRLFSPTLQATYVSSGSGEQLQEARECAVRHLPNILSLGRLVATVPLVILVLLDQQATFLIATLLFALASLTDTFDGRIARKYHFVSRLGIFLDLTADKVFVAAVLTALVQIQLVPAWIVIVIVTREFLVSGLRSLAAAQGVVIPAGPWGKQKTLLTLTAMGGILLALGFGGATMFPLGLSTGGAPHGLADYLLVLSDTILLLAVIWTIVSAIEYMRGAWHIFVEPAPKQSA